MKSQKRPAPFTTGLRCLSRSNRYRPSLPAVSPRPHGAIRSRHPGPAVVGCVSDGLESGRLIRSHFFTSADRSPSSSVNVCRIGPVLSKQPCMQFSSRPVPSHAERDQHQDQTGDRHPPDDHGPFQLIRPGDDDKHGRGGPDHNHKRSGQPTDRLSSRVRIPPVHDGAPPDSMSETSITYKSLRPPASGNSRAERTGNTCAIHV